MRGGTGRIAIITLCAGLIGLLIPPVPATATIAGCPQQVRRFSTISAVPDAQLRFDVDRLAPLAVGNERTIVVAVIDSGVDGSHRQLRDQVTSDGADYLGDRSAGLKDCIGHGTGVAGIIAAKPVDGVGFRGLAPKAKILPIRVTENTGDGKAGEAPTDPAVDSANVAAAIRHAVSQKVHIINLSLTLGPNDAVADAVADAVDKDIVVVAAAGNLDANSTNTTFFPAKYDGVLGVGAITAAGQRSGFSRSGDHVDIAAPGDAIVTTATGGGHQVENGTSFAAPFVSATAALIMQRYPTLHGQAVVQRIIDTADPAPGGRRSDEYGWGVVNPYRALTDTVVPAGPRQAGSQPAPTEDPAVAALQARRDHAQVSALRLGAVGGGLTLIVVLVALIVPNGRRRGWSPASPTGEPGRSA